MNFNTQPPPVQATHGATPQSWDGSVNVDQTAPATVNQAARPLRLLRLAEVEARTGLKKSTLYALMQSGDLPPSVRLSARAVAWHEQDIDRFILERVRSKVPA